MNEGNMFDQLNEALFAQLDKLQSVNPKDTEQMGQCIEQSKAVAALADKVIGNASTAITLIKMQSLDGGIGKTLCAAPKRLGGGE